MQGRSRASNLFELVVGGKQSEAKVREGGERSVTEDRLERKERAVLSPLSVMSRSWACQFASLPACRQY